MIGFGCINYFYTAVNPPFKCQMLYIYNMKTRFFTMSEKRNYQWLKLRRS